MLHAMQVEEQRKRLAPEARRAQLLRVATALLSERGVDSLQITDLAAAAGVSRPVVYRFFPNRQALIVGILETFETQLTERFLRDGLPRIVTGELGDAARVFVESLCDQIDEVGAGPWHLLGANGPDKETAEVARKILERIMEPWLPRIAAYTQGTERESRTVARMLLASGRACLNLWLEGELTREEAIRDTTRGINALLEAFSRATNPTR